MGIIRRSIISYFLATFSVLICALSFSFARGNYDFSFYRCFRNWIESYPNNAIETLQSTLDDFSNYTYDDVNTFFGTIEVTFRYIANFCKCLWNLLFIALSNVYWVLKLPYFVLAS